MTSTFDYAEYIAFALTLLISLAIGVYFGCIKEKQNTIAIYLLGGKQLSLLPVSMSLITAYVSGVTLTGIPAEVYMYGTQCQAATFALFLIGLFSAYVAIPVFYKLQLFSSYEYMELRFGHGVRIVLSGLFTIFTLMYIPLVMHGVAMAVNQVTGVEDLWITLTVSSVCIFYTTLGGLKAVVWTDTIQGVLMIVSTVVILAVGTVRAGGVTKVLSTASAAGRIEIFKSSLILATGVFFFGTISLLSGILASAEFVSCDPLTSGLIKRPDQILPFFVSKVCGDIRGLPGLFLAGIVCASLSSMSASLNTLSGTFYRDLLSPVFKVKPSESKALLIIKTFVVIFGTVSALGVYVIKRFGNLVMIIAYSTGLTMGPLVGIFILGLLFPWATNKGAICGGLASFLCMGWLTVGNAIYKSYGHFVYPTKEFRVDGCIHNFTALHIPQASDDSDIPYIYRITVFYNIGIGAIICVVIGLVASYLSGPNRLEDVNPDLVSPVIHRFLPKYRKEYIPVPLEMATRTINVNGASPEQKEEEEEGEGDSGNSVSMNTYNNHNRDKGHNGVMKTFGT